ncbi:MAG: c-type cytochrome [Parvularculaceae bacterium]
MKTVAKILSVLTGSIVLAGTAAASDIWRWPDGRAVLVVQPNEQVDLSSLKSGVKGQATNTRFNTNEGMYLANEIYLSGTEFFLRASERGLPIGDDPQLSYITNVEAYWYSRYNLMALSAHSRAGIGVVHGPYVDMRANEATRLNEFGRNRGELPMSNKDVMLTQVAASYLSRTGLPRVFDSAVPLMLEFASADPRLGRDVDIENDDSGRAAYLNDFDHLWWSHDAMDKTIDMGGVGQTMLKKVLWAKFFLRRNHTDDDFPGRVFLGNNAADGFRGSMLTLQAVSTMLMAKASLFADPSESERGFIFGDGAPKLTGINPIAYRPKNGLRYLPHEIRPELIYMGDLPVRHQDFSIKDSASNLWDQASWLWATTEFFHFANPRVRDNADQVFGYQTPVDGSIMEQKYALLAQGIANTVLDNMQVMHMSNGVLVSEWTPDGGTQSSVDTGDLSLAMVALAAYADYMDLEPERREKALSLLRQQADFLLKVANGDGSFAQRYDAASGAAAGERDATSQAFAIRGMLAAYNATDDGRYLEAARRTSQTWNRDFWDEAAWIYRNKPGDDHVVYTPKDVAATLAALREMILIDKDAALLDRFKRFFVQAVDASGLMQSEDIFTGEDIDRIRAGDLDSDDDGVPFISGAGGRHGVDTVFASRVEFNITAGHGASQPAAAPLVSRTGAEVYANNCAVCHGDAGGGNEGPRLVDNPYVQLTGAAGVKQTVANGRVSVGMPAWSGVLTDEQIDAVVGYIRSLDGVQE